MQFHRTRFDDTEQNEVFSEGYLSKYQNYEVFISKMKVAQFCIVFFYEFVRDWLGVFAKSEKVKKNFEFRQGIYCIICVLVI